MSHVDEGTLHAYLDGALDSVLPAGEAARVRQHLEVCDVCAARLREERELRDEAASILGLSAPPPGDLPAFEELRARAEAADAPESRPSRGGRIQRMAWAASVVLAVGAGWMLRGAWAPRLPSPARPVMEATPIAEGENAPAEEKAADVAATRAAERTESRQGAVPSLEEARGGAAAAKGAEAISADAAAPESPAPSVVADESGVSVAEAPEASGNVAGRGLVDRAPAKAVDSLAAILDSMSFPRTAVAARKAAALPSRDAGAAAPFQHPGALVQVSAGSSPAVTDAARRPDSLPAMKAVGASDTRSEAAMIRVTDTPGEGPAEEDSGTLVVPDLRVLSVVRLDAGQVAGAVRVRQLLASGDTLEIVHLPPGVRPSALPPVPEGETELVLVRGDGWLVLRARASRDVLDEMARRLQSPR